MSLSFILWAMANFNHMNFGICGKTVISAERNVIRPLMGIKYLRDNFSLRFANHILTVSRGRKTNTFYIFGGKDESSYQLIQGVTLAGVLLDEVALMPESFVDQALARCSVEGSKYWFNCNPEGPQHWFYREWILHPEEKNAAHLHFTMEDNPSLSAEIRERYESLYSGVFYDRYIRGLWVVAEGLIYPDVANGQGIVEPEPREYVQYYISIDYGTHNPFSAGLYGLYKGIWYRFDEYYHSGRETRVELDPETYYREVEKLAGKRLISTIVIDPSADAFIATIKAHGRFSVRQANNDVVDGIRETASAFKQGRLKVTKNCSGALMEFSAYRWDDKKQEDKPIKENDHAMDEIRYFVNTVMVHHGGVTIGGW
jgi:PBSX family phage terminase large subunit